ncbi:MAG: hypothetical protein JO015_00530 [Verrucomicrobia bacterium]|nr:hypothetical protein [Verrucomicrobiota bacterium]
MRRSLLLLGLMMCYGTAVTSGENRYGGDAFNADAAGTWQPKRFLDPAAENAATDTTGTWHANRFLKRDSQGSKPGPQAARRPAKPASNPSASRNDGSEPRYANASPLVDRPILREPTGETTVRRALPARRPSGSGPAAPTPVPDHPQSAGPDPRSAPPVPSKAPRAGSALRAAPTPVPANPRRAGSELRTASMPVPGTPRFAGLNVRTAPRFVPAYSRPAGFNLLSGDSGRYPWKMNIVTTIFWVGEYASMRNPVPNRQSAWDKHWSANYGGYDTPNPWARRNFMPVSFVPRQNPFYFALPYNDIERHHTKREAPYIIPWFRQTFVRDGQTVLKDRWIAIRHGNRVCYAQWEDCGPFRTDHWQYVFGRERPRPNLNQGAGLDVSPAVRDYLGLANKDVCDWRFVEVSEVPSGPWMFYHRNRPFAIASR